MVLEAVAGVQNGEVSSWINPVVAAPVLPALNTAALAPSLFSPLEEPTLFVVPAMDSWFQQHPGPVLPRPPSPMQYVVGTLEPSLLFVPLMSSWFQQASQPVHPKRGRTEEHVTGVELPHESIIPGMAGWYRETQQPTFLTPRADPGWWTGVTERTLFQTPNMDTWYAQQPDPVRRPRQLVAAEIAPMPEWRSLTLEAYRLAWLPTYPDAVPGRPPVPIADTAQPPAVTPDDATLPATDTGQYTRAVEDDDVHRRT